jgi:PAS domain S-box-containing protein
MDETLEAVIASSPDAIVTSDALGCIVTWNPAAERIFGFTSREILGQPLTRLIPRRYRAVHDAGLARVAATGEARMIGATAELAALRADGSEFPIELSLATWTVKGKVHFSGIIRDVSERRRLMESLTQSEERVQAIVTSATDAIACTDEAGRVVLWNLAAERMFGRSREDMLGQLLLAVIPERHRDAHEHGMRRLGRSGEGRLIGRTAELTAVRGDGSEFPIELSLGTWAAGGARYFSGIIRDISERKRAENAIQAAREAADDASRAKSLFLANMSHELRTPMNAIIGYSEMLLEDAQDESNEAVAGDLRKVLGAGKHLLSLINDVLDLSKIEAGKMDLYIERFEIGAMVEEVVATIEALIERNKNRLRIDVDPSLSQMRADVTKVRQALFNLLSNATKFTHEGEIVLRVESESVDGEDWVRLAVSDSGIGIPPEKLGHVFEEFSQAEDTTSRDYGGTGLGLPISQRFCRMMGGDILVESNPGEGSTFTIRLPMEVTPEESAADDAPLAPMPEHGAQRVVLVIDDDPNALELLERTLRGAGVQVVTASNGGEALRLARELHPVAITLDVVMPGIDGWEVLQGLKADPATRDIPVIMVTMTDDRSLGYALGATEFLTKPVQRTQLLKLLERYAPQDAERRALIVDDSSESREMLRRALETEGWQVSEAENGRVGLEKVAEQAVSLILLDLIMPVMDGFEFVMEMRKLDASSTIPIVVVTAKDVTEEDRLRLNSRVVSLVEKSGLDRESLLAQVRKQVAASELRGT